MSLYRTSTNVFRSNLRPCIARAQLHTSSLRAVKFEGKDMDDMGGPGGQVPPPQSPGGADAAKRNWVPIAAGVFTLGAGLWYMTTPKGEKLASQAKELEKRGEAKAEELKNKGQAKAGELKNRGEAKAEELKNKGEAKAEDLKNRAAVKAQDLESKAKGLQGR